MISYCIYSLSSVSINNDKLVWLHCQKHKISKFDLHYYCFVQKQTWMFHLLFVYLLCWSSLTSFKSGLWHTPVFFSIQARKNWDFLPKLKPTDSSIHFMNVLNIFALQRTCKSDQIRTSYAIYAILLKHSKPFIPPKPHSVNVITFQ